ncbi:MULTISPECIES: IlvD/Edd family dehydratase [unclassified Halomonas]|uniref:IlvD/Edd family dehydratase n=1 Tax=unclassified Halomonas TaxID=2609666 RepID=UPI0005FA7529|nr:MULTISPECIES: IlvD/Edd family dehydratase [unclassified Halomonas]KJZ06120.1 dihydroxy-acid dehydratase [Halomonas sp. S2151]MCJ8287478.1 dihydroxy-acid dehydratase family protein [Halomonas sp.]MCO7218057.1 dihydroxy-acid dehydratase family protein [Halomonas sp. OfavH-34-E]NQY72198.1 dihydroxy-acid dehydratase family protein [Halomonas sp.]
MTQRPRLTPDQLRSRWWFDNPDHPGTTALCIERYLNYGVTLDELTSGKPIIGIAQSGSDLTPCNRHHIELVKRVKDGIRAAGGVPFEFPLHPIHENVRRPTAALDRNLAYLGLVEVLHGYPLDGVVLTTGCDKTTPACLMAAATVNIPAIVLSGGPMLNGWRGNERVGSGTIIWELRKRLAAGDIDYAEFLARASDSAPSVGHCNTMGTASTMNSMAEALGMSLPGSAMIPGPYKERAMVAYDTGQRAVEMVWQDLRPLDILTREAFENAVVVCSALGGSSNAPIHVNAIARHAGVALDNDDWQRLGHRIPLLANVMPAGAYLGEEFHRAGGVPAVQHELLERGLLHGDVTGVDGRRLADSIAGRETQDEEVIRRFDNPLVEHAGFLNLKGNLFDSALMKTSVISPDFRRRFLENPDDPDAFEGRVVVFDGSEDYHARIDDPELGIDASTILIMRGAGPVGHPGGAEVVNMQPPEALIRQGIESLPCLGDGRQSGTSGSPSILNASPEAATGGPLALVQTGDRLRVDLGRCEVRLLVDDDEITQRRQRLDAQGGYPYPAHQTPWQEIQRTLIEPLDRGMTLRGADAYRDVARQSPPRDNH